MFENLKEVVKTFSFQTVLKGNILGSPGSFGSTGSNGVQGAKSNSPASNMVSNRYLSTYYNKIREMGDYEINELTSMTVGIYKDYLINYIDRDRELVSISDSVPDHLRLQNSINAILTELDIINEVKDHLWDIIFYGSWSFKLGYDREERKFIKYNLENPHNVITIKKDSKQSSHLVVSKQGVIFEVQPESIFRLGRVDLTLINDINVNTITKKSEDTLVKTDFMTASTPLYYNITGKIKEYLLKDQILSLLSIKDLIQPLLLLIQLDKNTSVDEGNKLALNVENMINKYSDISQIISSNFSINSLIDSLMNNIRVIPDYHSGVGNMGNVDLSKVTNKIQEIESSQDNKKDAIMMAMGIPRVLYEGSATKWDAIKSSQRLNSKINSIAVGISDSIKSEVIKFASELYGKELKPEQVTINLFKKTEVEYSLAITSTEMVGGLLQGIQQILQLAQQTMADIKIIDPESFAKYVYNQLKTVDPLVSEFMNEQVISNAIKQLQQPQ